jgi:DNA-binding transcriptional LysR family regulator
MDRLHAMELFARVIETGSISAAARDLRLGQPAISKTLAALETRLGVRLLVRTTRKLSPTDAGLAFYERARRVLADAEEAETAARGLAGGLEGRVRVCAPVTFARLHVAPKLPAFLAAHPKLRMEVIMDDRDVDLLSENIDVALRLGALADSSLVARRIAQCARCVVASPAYLAAAGTPLSPTDLLAHQAVVYAQASGGDEWRFRRGTTELSVNVPSRLTFSAAEGVREGVLAGLGLAIVSTWMMAPELRSGAVVRVLEDWRLPEMDLSVVFPAGRLPGAKARAFVTWFDAAMQDKR